MHQAVDQSKETRPSNDRVNPSRLLAELQTAVTSVKNIEELAKKQTDSDDSEWTTRLGYSFLHSICRCDSVIPP